MNVRIFEQGDKIPGKYQLRIDFSDSWIHPKKKIGSLTEHEKDLWGNPGGCKTKLSKNTYKDGCPKCGGEITKASYLGGTVYFCHECQII